MTHRGPFQPLPFGDSVILYSRWWHGAQGWFPAVQCLSPPLCAHSICHGGFVAVQYSQSTKPPHIDILAIVLHTTDALPAWLA